MSKALVYHPLGLGDHLICNGLVREYAARFGHVGVFSTPRNLPTVVFMYRDDPRITVLPITTHAEAEWFLLRNRFSFGSTHYNVICRVGTYDQENGIMFEREFYQSAGVPFEKRYSGFSVVRDRKREEMLYTKLSLPKDYIFLHDDARFQIDRTRITASLPIVYPAPELTDNLFDYGLVLERATEIHAIDSSFMFMADAIPYDNPSQRRFVHRYARPNSPWNLPLLRKPWEILEATDLSS